MPVRPSQQEQVKEPRVSKQVALGWQLWLCESHSSMLAHERPVPEYPALHAHVYDPAASVHVAAARAQLCNPCVHSLMSAHTMPLPVNPVRQLQENEPGVSVHMAMLTAQL